MLYGVQYYPEHWPRERWKTDAEMMSRAGVNAVRMGEFAWGAYEAVEGRRDFSWMEEAIELFGGFGIHTILCTCSRTPPPWVHLKYPGVLSTDQDQRTSPADERYRVGLAHPEFKALSQDIDSSVIRHFSGSDNIIAWQLDNEIGGGNDCYCACCRQAFHDYLREKYGTASALNEAWGSHFWSFSFDDFAEVPSPGEQPQLALEYRRFMSGLNVEFARWRADLIRRLDPGKPVVTNFQSFGASHTDYNELAKVIDVNGMNYYPRRSPEFAIDYYRGGRGSIWIMEQQTRLQEVDSPAGFMRLRAWLAIAHGADAVIFFRWRQCRWGQEQFADGLLPHSGRKNRFYNELLQMGEELEDIRALTDGTSPHARVAVAVDYPSRWSLKAAREPFGSKLDPFLEAADYHEAFSKLVHAVDAVAPREDLSRYRLVVAPRLWLVNEEIAANLTRYVEKGGTLCLTAGSGVVDEYGKSFDTPRPGLLCELAGITVSDLAYEDGMVHALRSDVIEGLNEQRGHLAADEIHPDSASPVAVYADGWRKGAPAVTLNSVGKGRVVYVGTVLDKGALASLAAWLCDLCNIESGMETDGKLSVYERKGGGGRIIFVFNWSDEPQALEPGQQWRDAFTGEPAASVELKAKDLKILFTRSVELD